MSSFVERHIGPNSSAQKKMLQQIQSNSLQSLIEETIPEKIRIDKQASIQEPVLEAAKTEAEFLKSFKNTLSKNLLFNNMIGQGYYGTHTPSVIARNILENPGWYTAYTPYQAEIAQGRLEMLFHFQTMVTELTGLPIANASLLDEGSAASEAMLLMFNNRKGKLKKANKFFVDQNIFSQTKAVIQGRADALGIEIIEEDFKTVQLLEGETFGALLQYPGANGEVENFSEFIEKCTQVSVPVAMACDLLSLSILPSPASMGASFALGTTQRFGVPVACGGPHAAYFACSDQFKRQIPGRIIGQSVDADGNPAYRMALQTREQHIRREKATSNICTAQVLLAVMAAGYGLWHGPKGLRKIALQIHNLNSKLSDALTFLGFSIENQKFFDTISFKSESSSSIINACTLAGINLFLTKSNQIQISLDETHTQDCLHSLLVSILPFAPNQHSQKELDNFLAQRASTVSANISEKELRPENFMQQEAFKSYQDEHSMLRYLKRLENKDLSMVHSMIPLGSCTMKLNAATEMLAISWPEISKIHPFAPIDQIQGCITMVSQLEKALAQLTGFAGISLQPNSGAQGEYAGLLVIQAWHKSQGQQHRNIALIPSSAHGTNPASAVMAGLKCVTVKCDAQGNIDVNDLTAKAAEHSENLSVFMVTYPSTHGVFEEQITDICKLIHKHGGQIYMDGANLNAQVGLTHPGGIGADVCHLNLHKTFAIPHGGGGPGVGPIGVAKHLVNFLPGHPLVTCGGSKGILPVSSAPWGSAGVLPISLAYIQMMGIDGLQKATQSAILNANYLMTLLKDHYPVLYTGSHGRCAHEFILDCRSFKSTAGVEVEDIAKRLMDFGFHAPTVSFPVAGTLMIEPTESEPIDELDRFAEALIQIRKEIELIEKEEWDKVNNPLKNAPHTLAMLCSDKWEFPYSRSQAAWPLEWIRERKFWPSVRRIDNAFGDRNLVCSGGCA